MDMTYPPSIRNF